MKNILEDFKELLDFRNILFLWSVILFSDVFNLFFFHKSIKKINYDYFIKLAKTTTLNEIAFFFILFSVSYFFIIPVINFYFENLWNLIYYNWDWLYKKINKNNDIYKQNYYIYPIFLKDYAILSDNKVIYDIYKNYKYNVKKSNEFNSVSWLGIITSVLDYYLSKKYNNGICILNVLSNDLFIKNSTEYFILGYIILLIILLFNILNGYINYYKDYIILSQEIKTYIIEELKKIKNE